jgi:predicted amidohydrolase
VVVFPELSLTGYELEAPLVDPDDDCLRPVIDACATAGSVALVGAPTSGAQGEHISVIAVDAGGASVAYRKMWLSDTEAERFVPFSSAASIGPKVQVRETTTMPPTRSGWSPASSCPMSSRTSDA